LTRIRHMTKREWRLNPNDKWQQTQDLAAVSYTCGYCGDRVGVKEGYFTSPAQGSTQAFIRICPSCRAPSFFVGNVVLPAAPPGSPVSRLPADVEALYEEARAAAGAGAQTAAVLVCRKILMHVGVQEKAEKDKNFLYYVEYLAKNGFVPPKGKAWVDYIRTRGNEANHEITIMTEADSRALITFVEMLLRFIYEFPGMVPSAPTVTS
jgi:hypothetical protein